MRFDLALAVVYGRGQLAEEASKTPSGAKASPGSSNSMRITSMDGLRSFLGAEQMKRAK